MKAKVVKEPSIEISSVHDLVTNVAEIQAFDLYKVDTSCVNFTAPFEFTIKKTGSLTAIVGYFDVSFDDLDNPISFSTGPHAPATHWKQTVFSLTEPISITEGQSSIISIARDSTALSAIFSFLIHILYLLQER